MRRTVPARKAWGCPTLLVDGIWGWSQGAGDEDSWERGVPD